MVYLKNLFDYIATSLADICPVYLSSGYYYANQTEEPYIQQEPDYKGIACYSIVNSPIIAPQCKSWSVYTRHQTDQKLLPLLRQFILQHGPFDVIHFHSFEGLTTKVLQLKDSFPSTRFVYTMHDYGIICPDVRLWSIQKTKCNPQCQTLTCTQCLSNRLNHYYTDFLLPEKMMDGQPHRMTIISRARRRMIIAYNYLLYRSRDIFKAVRRQNVAFMNRYLDSVLAVSDRVKQIAVSCGIEAEKVTLSYIGTEVAQHQLNQCQTPVDSPLFTLLFMGSSAYEKGLGTLLSALEAPSAYRKKYVLKVAASIYDHSMMERLDHLRPFLHDLILYNGYTHQDFSDVMKDVNVGVVPPLWEDNLPQVAIEMVAHGIPVICSMNGGAHELNHHPDFQFLDTVDLKEKIEKLYLHRTLLNDYWTAAVPLTTMEQHMNELLHIYANDQQ